VRRELRWVPAFVPKPDDTIIGERGRDKVHPAIGVQVRGKHVDGEREILGDAVLTEASG
jgi:hypothetical protein